jgi:hypothetical protein
MRCDAHILNLVVNNGLKDVDDVICNIKNTMRYLRPTLARMAKFEDCIERKNLKCKKMVCVVFSLDGIQHT